ncbi:metal-sensitive transcriptional regulator [Bacillus sp. B-jedd]|uniref:metal-sensitive transcriptional regulator n=1 Tax=Bacillus sp. B-jedd TaxID=1476857 RepID=UPI00051555F9|nr:metal-sensitive transcriptional regulator [Bacillus sp. B-jedd]CEG29005.1 repressor of copper utilisation proteins [Bacillus sp. B-jedd]
MNLLNPEEQVSAKAPSEADLEEKRVAELGNCEDQCCHEGSARKSHHSEETKRKLVSRLNRIEGQIRGIKGLIEKDTYCDDVITQISATQAALNSVAKLLFEGHMKSCIVERIQEGDDEVIDELLVTIQRMMKK